MKRSPGTYLKKMCLGNNKIAASKHVFGKELGCPAHTRPHKPTHNNNNNKKADNTTLSSHPEYKKPDENTNEHNPRTIRQR